MFVGYIVSTVISFLYDHIPQLISTCDPLVAQQMPKQCSTFSQAFVNMTSITVHIAACILVFNSSTSAIGVEKTLSLIQPRRKNQEE